MSLLNGLLAALGLTHSTQTQGTFLFTFGDSYSSTGYDPASVLQPSYLNPLGNPLYPGVTTAGGANWVDKLTYDHPPEGYTTFTYNYAYPGALVNHSIYPPGSYLTTTDFVSQVNSFQVHGPKNFQVSNVAAIAYWGTNDILVHAEQTNAGDNSIITAALDAYWSKIEQLYLANVRNFVVFTADPVERVPLATLQELKIADYATLCKVSRLEWNRQLEERIASFKKSHADAKVATVDLVPVWNEILDNPQKYGAPNNGCANTDGKSCLFYDIIHPGQALHTAIAASAAQGLQDIGFWKS